MMALGDQILVSGGNFVIILLGARFLALEDQGKLGYILSAYLAVSIFGQASIFQLASVEAPKVDPSYHDFIQILQMVISFVSSILLTTLLVLLGAESGWKVSAIEFLMILFFLFCQQQADFVRRSAYIFSSASVSLISSAVIYPPRLLAILALRPSNISVFVLILGVTTLIPAAKSILDLGRAMRCLKILEKFTRPHFIKAQWLILGAPFSWLWCNIPIYILGMHGNLAQVGIFTTLRSLTNAGNVLLETLETYISALMGKAYAQNRTVYTRLIRIIFVSGLIIWSAGFWIFLFMGRDLVNVLFDNGYTDFSPLLIYLWTGILSVFFSRLSAVTSRTVGKTNTIFVSFVIGSFISYGVSLLLIPQFNIYGAAIAIGVAPLIMCMFQEVDVRLFINKQTRTLSKEIRL